MKLNLFPRREKFLVLDIAPAGSSALFLSVTPDRKLIFEKLVKGIDLKKFLGSTTQKVARTSWEGEMLFKGSRRKVIAAAHPSLATTVPIPLSLAREHGTAESEITLTELENMIAQAMAKTFNQCRNEAGKRLGTDELDTILVGAKARSFAVDGNAVMNPVGFPGKKVNLILELTFTGRELFGELHQFFKAPEEFFFVESPQVRLGLIARGRSLPLNLITADGPMTSLFIFEKVQDRYPVLYRERLDWDPGSILAAVMDNLAVSYSAAGSLYRRYREGEMSAAASRAFKKIIDAPLAGLFAAIEKSGIHGTAYLDLPFELPFALPHRDGKLTLAAVPVAELLAAARFSADFEKVRESPAVISRYLSPFLESYFDDADPAVNEKLRRRLHWLAE